jgi:hypothetical protein
VAIAIIAHDVYTMWADTQVCPYAMIIAVFDAIIDVSSFPMRFDMIHNAMY